MSKVVVRLATPADLPNLRSAMVELQEHERRLAATRLPGEQIADPYLARLLRETAEKRGAIFVVESDGVFAGFAAGWIIERDHIPESEDSNRFGYLSDICVMPAFRGKRIAHRLLAAMERHFARAGATRFRLFALAANTQARASYEGAGFAPYEILMRSLWTDRRWPPPASLASAEHHNQGLFYHHLRRSPAAPGRCPQGQFPAFVDRQASAGGAPIAVIRGRKGLGYSGRP